MFQARSVGYYTKVPRILYNLTQMRHASHVKRLETLPLKAKSPFLSKAVLTSVLVLCRCCFNSLDRKVKNAFQLLRKLRIPSMEIVKPSPFRAKQFVYDQWIQPVISYSLCMLTQNVPPVSFFVRPLTWGGGMFCRSARKESGLDAFI